MTSLRLRGPVPTHNQLSVIGKQQQQQQLRPDRRRPKDQGRGHLTGRRADGRTGIRTSRQVHGTMEYWGGGGCESPWNGHREMAGWARAKHYHQQGPGHRANAGRSATRESGQQRVRACSVDRVEERGRLGWSASGRARSSKMPPPSVKSRGALGEVVRSGDQGE